jgi:integrase
MASKRMRSGSWEYRIKSKLLEKPAYFTFDTEAEGDAFAAKVERELAAGRVPEWLVQPAGDFTLGGLIEAYTAAVAVAPSQLVRLRLVRKTYGSTLLTSIDYDWVEAQVNVLKSQQRYTPVGLKRFFGALALALDWAVRKQYSGALTANPVRLLPAGYATYHNREVEDIERNRRVDAWEEEKILKALDGEPEYRLLVVLALETAMRLSEIYPLSTGRSAVRPFVDLRQQTIFLPRGTTKTGEAREVPMSSVCEAALKDFKGFAFGPKSVPTGGKISKYFQRLFERLELDDLHFHDLRHEATCRLYERTRFTDTQISRITGHRDPRQLRRYASLRGSDLVGGMW